MRICTEQREDDKYHAGDTSQWRELLAAGLA